MADDPERLDRLQAARDGSPSGDPGESTDVKVADLSDDEMIARLVQRGIAAGQAPHFVDHYRWGCETCVRFIDEMIG